MRQVIKHRDIRLLKMIRRTDPVIQLFDERRTAEVWDNFMECLNENTK